jgi:hypothetical protein
LLRFQIRAGLLLALNGASALFDQILGTRSLFLSELQLCFGLLLLRFRLVDLFSLAVELRLDIGDVGLGHCHLGLRLIDRDPVVPIVDAGAHITCIDVLIVGHGNRGYIPADFWRDRKTAGCDKRIVGRFEMAGVQPVKHTTDQRGEKDADDDHCENPMLAKSIPP